MSEVTSQTLGEDLSNVPRFLPTLSDFNSHTLLIMPTGGILNFYSTQVAREPLDL